MPRARFFSLALAPLFAAPILAEPAAPTQPIVLVLDASGSMWGKVGPEAKIVSAKKVLGDLVDQMPAAAELGLVAYGHRREGDCEDVEVLLSPGPLDRARAKALVAGIQPKGKTPITRSVEAAFATLGKTSGPATVVLLSDGLETCGGDPCAAVKLARSQRSQLVFHVVGFDVAKEDVSSLECAAQAGGGLYLAAQNAAELKAALESTTAPPDTIPSGALLVEAKADGKLQDVVIKVYQKGTRKDVIAGRTYANAETNPRRLPLADGEYDVEVAPVGIRAEAAQRFTIRIEKGGVVDKKLDFSTGELRIGATRNGELSDVTYTVFPAGGKKAGTQGRTYRSASSNPVPLRLSAGVWDVELKALEIAGQPTWRQNGIEVKAGQSASVSHDFSSGTLKVGAVAGQDLVDAVVRVALPDGKGVDQGRTYKSATSNPKTFVLAPGRYRIEVSAIKVAGDPRREIEVTLTVGETILRTIDFDQP